MEQPHPALRQLPGEWPITRIGSVFSIVQGKQVSARSRSGDRSRPFLRTKNVHWGRFDLANLDCMHFSEEEEARLALMPGDLLTCEGGWVGRSAMWTYGPGQCLFQNHLHRLRRASDDIEPQFGLFWLWYAFELGDIYVGRHNVTTIPNLSKSRLGELPIPLPPHAEQRRIATILSVVQRSIERQERLIALTSELRVALMHKLLTEGVRGGAVEQTEIGTVPSNWRVERLGEHLLVAQYGLSAKGSESGETPILRMTNQVDGRIDLRDLQYVTVEESLRRKYSLKAGDVLLNRTNSFDLVGRTALFDLRGEYVFASYLIRLRPNADALRPAFLNHLFNWPATQRRLKGIATRAVSQSNISASRLRQFLVPVPPLVEQDQISENLSSVEEVSMVHQNRLAALQQLFRSLLHQLMTAQIRVRDLDLSALESASQEPVGAT